MIFILSPLEFAAFVSICDKFYFFHAKLAISSVFDVHSILAIVVEVNK